MSNEITTIAVLAERIHRILSKGDISRDSQWDIRDLEYFVRDVAAKLIKGAWFEERNEGGKNIDSRFVVTFNGIKIQEDESTGENYIEIPVDSYIRLPNDSGIRSVRPDSAGTDTKRTKQMELRAFIPIPNRFLDIYYQLPAAALEQQFGYMIRKDKIYFTDKPGRDKDRITLLDYDVSEVSVDVVTVDPVAVGIDDPLPLPNEYVPQLIQEVLTLITGGSPQVKDILNDGNPNIVRAE